MKLNKLFFASSVLAASMALSSCVGDLDVKPTNPTQTTELTTKDQYIGLMMRAYGGLVMEGGISVDDGGAGVYTRQLFNQQELPTDECVIGFNWNDAGIDELVFAIPSPSNHWIYEMYSRIEYQIALCNNVIQTLKSDGAKEFFTEEEITEMVAEMRILRALSYYHMIDIFGHGPWTDENSVVGEIPPTYTRTELFETVVADLKDAIPQVSLAANQEYGRVSREAGYTLLAKLYLNAGVYTGTPMWQECYDACAKVVETLNNLAPTYKYLFCASNYKYVACSTYGTAQGEIIWTVPQDEITMQTYGGTTYLSTGAYGTDSPVASYGLNGDPWQGPHMRPETIDNFTNPSDQRYLFYEGQFTKDLDDLTTWGTDGTCGYQCIKYVLTTEDHYLLDPNANKEDNPDHKYLAAGTLNSADFPLFRLADVYLMITECWLNGVSCDGIGYLNKVRARAGITELNTIDADELLAERNRELYWEAHRRSDLIRFGKYTGTSYNWQWRGGVRGGAPLDSYRTLMPIPSQFVNTLGQNDGY